MRLPFLESRISLETRWKPASQLRWKNEEAQTVLVDEQEGKAYHFRGAGVSIWNGAARGLNGLEIVELLSREFEAPPKKLSKDVSAFLSQLRSQDLIEPLGESLHA